MCPICGARLIYFFGNMEVVQVVCINECDISARQEELIKSYDIESLIEENKKLILPLI